MSEGSNRRRWRRGAVSWGVVTILMAASAMAEVDAKNRFRPFPPVEVPEEGISWPEGQALPVFATPMPEIDAIEVQSLNKDEQLTFSALQGHVNRKRPRIWLLDARSGEGRDTWQDTATVAATTRKLYERSSKYQLVAKYADEIRGVVLYDTTLSPHYRNLAGTLAGVERALPVTREVFGKMKDAGIRAEVVADLTGMEFTTPLEIYGYLHERIWPRCEKRVIVSAKPHDDQGGGDYHHTRDIAAACGAAVVWLDCRREDERDLMRKFFRGMKAGSAVALGWYSSERSGITTASEFGIGTLPADHFVSASVLSGSDHRIRIPVVPPMPPLENKVYVAIFISDGDNIQYTQHAMRQIWDRHAGDRGKVPLNWTIAPGLVDIAPGILNYYYTTATPKDCFVTGPSGMGYLMPVNTLTEPGAPIGEFTKDPERMDGYARLTEIYLHRSGLRVATIWDNASPAQRASYERHCRQLYGATVQNFRDVPSVAGSVENGRLPFEKLVIPYAGTYEHISRSLNRELRRWDGRSPAFLAYQVDIWGEMKPQRIVQLHEELSRRYEGNVEFVRADHYFNLRSKAEKLPYNLAMAPETSLRSGNGDAAPAADGTPATLWSAEGTEERWIGFDFGAIRKITRCIVRHAGAHGLPRELNTRAFTIRASSDGRSWKTVDAFRDNRLDVTDVDLESVSARYVRIVVDDPGGDGVARIADVEIHGRD